MSLAFTRSRLQQIMSWQIRGNTYFSGSGGIVADDECVDHHMWPTGIRLALDNSLSWADGLLYFNQGC